MAMMAITTSSSISVNARPVLKSRNCGIDVPPLRKKNDDVRKTRQAVQKQARTHQMRIGIPQVHPNNLS